MLKIKNIKLYFTKPSKPSEASNLMSQIASTQLLDAAFQATLQKHIERETGPNHPIWSYSRTWNLRKDTLRQELQLGTFNLAPVQQLTLAPRLDTPEMNVSIWEPESEIVLKVLTLVLEPYLKSCMDLTKASHLKDYGGLKSCVKLASKHQSSNKFIFKTDIAKFYASIDHKYLINFLSEYIKDERVLDLILQFANRCEIRNAEHILINHKSIPRGCPLSPLMGAVYLHAIDSYAKSKNLTYVRYMDDFIFFAKTRWQLRKIIKSVYSLLDTLKLKLALDKTFIGKCSKGFDFLGYHIGGPEDQSGAPAGLSIAKTSFARFIQRIYWLYEQQAAYGDKFVSRLNRYVKNWIRWAKAGVGKVYLPNTILTHINFKLNNITPRPSCRAKILISNDMCLV